MSASRTCSGRRIPYTDSRDPLASLIPPTRRLCSLNRGPGAALPFLHSTRAPAGATNSPQTSLALVDRVAISGRLQKESTYHLPLLVCVHLPPRPLESGDRERREIEGERGHDVINRAATGGLLAPKIWDGVWRTHRGEPLSGRCSCGGCLVLTKFLAVALHRRSFAERRGRGLLHHRSLVCYPLIAHN